MTPSVYVLGGAGAGKSTFTQALLEKLEALPLEPLEDLHTKANARGTPVTLRGHRSRDGRGLYIGCMRASFPGTDGLDRASSISGEEWLDLGRAGDHAWLLAEGATLSTRRFLSALQRHTDLLVIHLHVDPMIAELRFLARGSYQEESFVKASATRAANRFAELKEADPDQMWASVDTDNADACLFALGMAVGHLTKESSPED